MKERYIEIITTTEKREDSEKIGTLLPLFCASNSGSSYNGGK